MALSDTPSPTAGPDYHVRALERGLLIIELLNRANGMTINDVAAQTQLPRPTAFRFLHTLMDLGYVVYAARARQYRLTAQARALSQGYQYSSWITDIAVPTLDRLAVETPWPLTLCILDGADITIGYITDQSSQLIVRRVSSGVIIPPLWSAAGMVFLAFSDAEKTLQVREKAVADIAQSRPFTPQQHLELDQRIESCREEGYSIYGAETSLALAVPVMVNDSLKAAIAIRVVAVDESSADDQAQYIASLKRVAERVEQDLTRLQDVPLPL